MKLGPDLKVFTYPYAFLVPEVLRLACTARRLPGRTHLASDRFRRHLHLSFWLRKGFSPDKTKKSWEKTFLGGKKGKKFFLIVSSLRSSNCLSQTAKWLIRII